MAIYGPMEKNAVRRGYECEKEFISWGKGNYCEFDKLDRIVYSAFEYDGELREEYTEYYKETEKITSLYATVTNKDGDKKIIIDNKFNYTDDGRICLIDTPAEELIKKYDNRGRLIYYKDCSNCELEWKYDENGKPYYKVIQKGCY